MALFSRDRLLTAIFFLRGEITVKRNAFYFVVTLAAVSVLFLTACNKKAAKVVPPAAPAPTAPSATLTASPDVIQQGQSTTLTWSTINASSISIEGLGELPASGTRSVTPDSSITYTLTAKGAGGSQDASARVTVNPVAAKVEAPSPREQDLFANIVKDVFFDYNKSDLRTSDSTTAQKDGSFLSQHPDLRVVIEGHCDDRGSEEYNLALGDSRANSLKQSLIAEGVSADHIKTVSYGKEHPYCSQDNEQCWQQNRRDHV